MTAKTESYVTCGPWPPPACLRLRLGEPREAWRQRLAEAMPHADDRVGKGQSTLLAGYGRRCTPAADGQGTHWIVQEEGSQVIALAWGTKTRGLGSRCLRRRGNKTTLLAELAGNGRVGTADLHASELATLRKQVERLGAELGATHAVDWSVGTGEVPQGYDRVLVDAPVLVSEPCVVDPTCWRAT